MNSVEQPINVRSRLRQFFSPQISHLKENKQGNFLERKVAKRAFSSKQTNCTHPATAPNDPVSAVFSKIRINLILNKPSAAQKHSENTLFKKTLTHSSKPKTLAKPAILKGPSHAENALVQKSRILKQIQVNGFPPKKGMPMKRDTSTLGLKGPHTKRENSAKPVSSKDAKEQSNSSFSSKLNASRSVLAVPKGQSRDTVPITFGVENPAASEHLPKDLMSISANFFKISVKCLLLLREKIFGSHETSQEVQEFLEKNRFAPELEKRLNEFSVGGFSNLLFLQKLSLLMVLFTLNYVEIRVYRHSAMNLIEEFLTCYSLSLSFLRSMNSDPNEDKELEKLIAELPEVALPKNTTQDVIKSLQNALKTAKKTLVELVFHLYRSRDLCVRLESLAIEAEKLSCQDVQTNAFNLFDMLLRGSCGDIVTGVEGGEQSFSWDSEDPNIILQPIKVEKYLPPVQPDEQRLTLVLDLDETLVHFEENPEGGEFLVRPFASEFLDQMGKLFEIVIFTAAMKDYADWILDRIDSSKSVSFRLYRQHTQPQNGIYLKDLNRLGRDLSRVVIVDNNAENFQLQPENGIYIKTWHNDPNDTALIQLAKLLGLVAEHKGGDVRDFLRELQQKRSRKTKI